MGSVHLELPYLLTNGFLPDAADSLRFSRILIGLWLLLTTAQWLTAANLFAEDGPLPWSALARVRQRPLIGRLRRRMSMRALRALLIIQLGVALILLASASMPVMVGSLALLIATFGGFVFLTGNFWADGSDKMGMIVMAGSFLVGVGILMGDPAVAFAGILMTGGQLAICYMVAGVSKLFVADWRSGAELAGVLDTESWGHAAARKLSRHRAVALIATWALILAEALFPLALLTPHAWLVAALAAFLAFHVATAVLMGLNTFPWAFAAAYPSVLLLSRVIRSLLGWEG